jgi:predicted nucleic acid-binding protein
MNVVSNTSPIIFLSKIEALDLLPQCFDKIFIPQAVVEELRDLSSPDYIFVSLFDRNTRFIWYKRGTR